MSREYTTDLTELKVKDFFDFQRALLTLTMGENYASLRDIIVKSLTLISKKQFNEAHHELVAALTVINAVEEGENSIVDGLKALLKKGDIDNARYKDLVKEFEEVKKKSLMT